MYDAPGDYTLSFLTKDGLVGTSSLYYCIHCLNKLSGLSIDSLCSLS
ncbi:MAG: hypothetical protein ACJAX1_000632 [Neolewinella sp.]|jgi:hypothetical protein